MDIHFENQSIRKYFFHRGYNLRNNGYQIIPAQAIKNYNRFKYNMNNPISKTKNNIKCLRPALVMILF